MIGDEEQFGLWVAALRTLISEARSAAAVGSSAAVAVHRKEW